jgi:beta-glucanase (GH16 family)
LAPEIGIFEILGNATTTDNMHFHYADSAGVVQDSGATYTGPNFASGYHIFGIDLKPTAITWYVDGVQVRNFTQAAYIPAKPFYVLANLAVGGNWPGAPNSATPFPSDIKVDYLSVWKK